MDKKHTRDAKATYVFLKGCEILCENLPALVIQMQSIKEMVEGGEELSLVPVLSFAATLSAWAFNFASVSFDLFSDPKRVFLDTTRDIFLDSSASRTRFFVADLVREFGIIGLRALIYFNLSGIDLWVGFNLFWTWTLGEAFLIVFLVVGVRKIPCFCADVNGLHVINRLIWTLYLVPTFYHAGFESSSTYQLGGRIWSLTNLWNILAMFVAIRLNGNSAAMNQVGAILAVCVLSGYLVMSRNVKEVARKEHFWANTSLRDHRRFEFDRNDCDEVKINAIKIMKLYTLEFRGEIETWFKASYPRWKVERPELITDNLLSFMDDEWLQFVESADEAVANHLVEKKERRRRSSFGELLEEM